MHKLTIELIPETSFELNLYKLVSFSIWKKTREDVYNKFNNQCGICLEKEVKLNCHEIWDFDDSNYLQSLKGLMALCKKCHGVKHFGRSQIFAAQGMFDINDVINHFLIVNNCTLKEFEEHKKTSYEQWRDRSQYEWKIDFGEFQVFIDQEKERKVYINNPKYLTASQFSQEAGINSDYVRSLIRKGTIEGKRVGESKLLVIHQDELTRYKKNIENAQ